ncbi:MAG: hypothetical protein ACKV2U_02130 [Bryobacteraceae bacterium]
MKCFPLILSVALLPLSAQNYKPLTAEERVKWFGVSTFGPRSLFISGPFTSAWRTYTNRPEEWGPHWGGFGKRYAARLLNNTVNNGVEASLGAVWNEDPRYFRLGEGSVGRRLGQAVKQTVMSRYGDGEYRFGFARAIGITGGSFGQKLWMPDSVTSNRDCVVRIGGNYAGQFVGNLFREFSPELLKKLKLKKN